jgi:hypothetical protein
MDIRNLTWADFLTPQEHALIGSTVTYGEKFYTPIMVQKGAEPFAVDNIRGLYKTFYAQHSAFEYMDGSKVEPGLVEVELASLNLNGGKTLQNPKPVDKDLRIKNEPQYRLDRK